jgi:hypothetical protein
MIAFQVQRLRMLTRTVAKVDEDIAVAFLKLTAGAISFTVRSFAVWMAKGGLVIFLAEALCQTKLAP